MTKPCLLCKKELSPIKEEFDLITFYCKECKLEQSIFIPEKLQDKNEYKQGELI